MAEQHQSHVAQMRVITPGRVILAVLAVAAALVAIFPLSAWAEGAAWHHAAQHVLIFGGGLGFGASFLARRNTKERS